MRTIKLMGLTLVAVAAICAMAVASASAFAATHCVKAGKETVTYTQNGKTKTKSVYTGSYTEKECTTGAPAGTYRAGGEPEGKYEKLSAAAFTPSEESELKALLKYVKVEPSGIDSKPTVQVSGANVQIESGEGNNPTLNGEGNLYIGYDESPGKQEGSNNLVIGAEQTYDSYSSIIAGTENTDTGPFSVVFGVLNSVASFDTVTGGRENAASGAESSVTGGRGNTSSSTESSVTGGKENKAENEYTAINGGVENKATGKEASVNGGRKNTASGIQASVLGGAENEALAGTSSVSGGVLNKAKNGDASISGGKENTAEGGISSILGGFQNITENTAELSTIFGGKKLKTTAIYGVEG